MLFLAALLLAGAAPASTAPDSLRYFPLRVGNSWVYRGTMHSAVLNREETATAQVEVTRTVARVKAIAPDAAVVWLRQSRRVLRSNVTAAALREAIPSPRYLVYFLDGRALYDITYWHAPPRLSPKRLRRELKDVSPVFIFPLFAGQRFEEPGAELREDGFYQWVVDRTRPVSVEGRTYRRVYRLRYQTCPDTTEIYFIPHVGIARDKYTHHGTIDEWDLRLVRSFVR
jgi:hypothetical protein